MERQEKGVAMDLMLLFSGVFVGAAGASFVSILIQKTKRMPRSDTGKNEIQDLLDSLPTPVMGIDTDFNIQVLNSIAAKLVGKRPEQLLGTKCFDLFCTGDCRTERCALHRAMRDRVVRSSRTVAQPGRQGPSIPITYTGSPLFGPNGEVVGAIEFVQDISVIDKAQRQVHSSTTELTQLATRLSELSREQQGSSDQISQSAGTIADSSRRVETNFLHDYVADSAC